MGLNIKTDLKETGCLDLDWLHVERDRIQWRDLANLEMGYKEVGGIS
jgi:hypothetical protein